MRVIVFNLDQRYQLVQMCGSHLVAMTVSEARSRHQPTLPCRSYIVETPSGEVRRTREHLVPVPEETHVGQKSTVVSQEEPAVDERSNYSTPSSPIASRTRLKTGVSILPPQRF